MKYLIKTCARFTRGEANLEVVLGSQNCLFGKVGLGYNPSFQKKTKKFSNFFFQKVSQMTCHSFPATTVCQKVMLLRTVMLENMMFLKGL